MLFIWFFHGICLNLGVGRVVLEDGRQESTGIVQIGVAIDSFTRLIGCGCSCRRCRRIVIDAVTSFVNVKLLDVVRQGVGCSRCGRGAGRILLALKHLVHVGLVAVLVARETARAAGRSGEQVVVGICRQFRVGSGRRWRRYRLRRRQRRRL